LDYQDFIDNAEYFYSRFSFRIRCLFDLLGIECSKENIIVMIRSCLFEVFGISMQFTGKEIKLKILFFMFRDAQEPQMHQKFDSIMSILVGEKSGNSILS